MEADGIKEHVTAEVQKLLSRHGDLSRGTTYQVDHAAIRTSLERGGFTATQLLSLHKCANLPPPMRVNAAGALVPEKAKYQLAQSLCSAAGSGQHAIPSKGDAGSASSGRQMFDYEALGAWMEALRHQRPLAEWEPPVHAPLLEPPPPKRQRKADAKQPAVAERIVDQGKRQRLAKRIVACSQEAVEPQVEAAQAEPPAAPACLVHISAPPLLPCSGKQGPPSASAPCDLEYVAGCLEDSGLSAEDVRRRFELFPKTAALPIWRAGWGDLVRLPEAPSYGQMVVNCPKVRAHHYIRVDAAKKTAESDALLTAMARVYFTAIVTREHQQERRAARASLLLDYHPDKLDGAHCCAEVVNYIQTALADEQEPEW